MASTNKSYAPFLSRPGTTFAGAVRYIAEVSGYKVGPLPSALDAMTEHYGWCSFGLSMIDLGSIAELFPSLEWNVSNGHLTMTHGGDAPKAAKQLGAFDEVAGQLMKDAQRKASGRLADGEYQRIAAELDRKSFRPLQFLEGKIRDVLAAWNQKDRKRHPAVHTWAEAVVHQKFRRGVRRTLNRAEEKFRNALVHES